MKHTRGFTLMELMIVVAVIGILAAIALPIYSSSVVKSRRSSAQSALLDLSSREERYFAANNAYTADLAALGYGVTSGATSMPAPDSKSHYYDVMAPTMTSTNGTNSGYTLKAVPATSQVKDLTCYTFTYNNFGVRGNVDPSGGPLTACWN